MEHLELVKLMAQTLYDRKAYDILALDVRHLTVICEYMVIATGRNANQVKSLADAVDDKMAENAYALKRSEGGSDGKWIVLDYGDIMVHIFHQEERKYYNLERLWNDGTNAIDLGLAEDDDSAPAAETEG
ncbi:MAG: ribosome silencing factor [Clostridia bacterium]|nr:ribosome silencing factor [Clostridia bacterium]